MDENKESAVKETEKPIDPTDIESVEPKEMTESESQGTASAPLPEGQPQSAKKANRFRQFLKTKKGKAAVIIGVLILIAAILFAIPATRYGILGTFLKKNVQVMVMDSMTMKPVSQADVSLGDKTAKTGHNGEVTLENIPVGEYTLKVTKGYYKNAETNYEVPVFGNVKETHISLVATGRQVKVSVANKITGEALTGAVVTVRDTSAATDDKGEATIVLPADQKTLEGTVTLSGYNQSNITVTITDDQGDANKVTLTPAGEVYYLSKQTGKINVMKSHLDGSSASVVVEGTGNENDRETVLLAARDWSYMALSSNRDPKKIGQLYLVDAKTGALKVIDEGDASFQLVGWSGHKFIYMVTRNNRNSWEGNTQRLKSYDAQTGKLTVLDENAAMGTNGFDYQYEVLQTPYILEGKIVYSKIWYQGQYVPTPSDKKSAIMAVNPDGSQKQRAKEFTMQRYISIEAKLYEPQEVYFKVSADGAASTYYEYQNGTVKGVTNTDDKFYNTFYPTYLVSPNGQKTFWFEPRDGKNTLLVGDKNGKDGAIFANQSEYKTYGWYTDKYLLVTKNDSELFITSAGKAFEQPLKITNYHKPNISFPGYGYGYGGQ